jgi:hypothetical protein
MKRLLVACVVFLSGCSSPLIHTEITTPICIRPAGAYHYATCNNLDFKVEGDTFRVPRGFDTDLASIPRLAWPVISPFHSNFIRPAIVHDFLYRGTCVFTRLDADLIFYQMLVNEGVPTLKASVMYYAVHWFGGAHYSEGYCESDAS